MQRMDLEAEQRQKSGKGVARTLRRAGRIPAVLYGEGKSSLLSIHPAELIKIFKSESGENALINLKIKGEKSVETRTAILRDYQKDPITGGLLHADLFEINMNKAIRIRVPITVKGDLPEGVKEGGVLQHNLREVEIECLPSMIPDHLDVDAAHLKIGESIHVRDLQVQEGIRVLEDKDLGIVSIAAPMSEAKLEEILAGTPAETKEPELIGKKKEEEGEAGAVPEAVAGAKPGEKAEAKGEVKAPKPGGKEEKKEAKKEPGAKG
ncbi:MAG: 50S ribosomal protein L25 [Nitrospirae bacterium]|nr:50S ribosomal protein L25 [Nitrospirota bacterium]